MNDVSAVQVFHKAIKEKAEFSHVLGDIILSFKDVLLLIPRGSYDINMFLDFLCLQVRMDEKPRVRWASGNGSDSKDSK